MSVSTSNYTLYSLSRWNSEFMYHSYIVLSALITFLLSPTVASEEINMLSSDSNNFNTYLNNKDMELINGNDAIVAIGVGGHRIQAGQSIGVYLSGITPITNTNFGVYARGEIIRDEYKTGSFWSLNMAIGAGYYVHESIIPFVTVGKCFSNYSTCYFNFRHPTANDDDIDAIYYGFGTYLKEPIFNNTFEISIDWSPYKNYNGRTLYLGYGFRF